MQYSVKHLRCNCKITGDAVTELFSETQSRFLLSVSPEQQEAFEAIVTDAIRIGTGNK